MIHKFPYREFHLKRFLNQFFLLIILLIHFNCYLLHLTGEQISITFKKRKIPEILADQSVNSFTRKKLLLVQDIRQFAVNQLFLNANGGYTYFAPLDRKEVGWNVSATWPLEFKSYTWWFPFAGTVPYKGFFDENKARQEEENLKQQGFDTRIRVTGAYSTLGWFSDPILSPHLQYSDDGLAGLVIHEMAHATVYFTDDSVFNESYATFVEEEGVERYFKSREGNDSATLRERAKKKQINQAIKQILIQTAGKLDELYHTDKSREEKLQLKHTIIQTFKKTLLDDPSLSRAFNHEAFSRKEFNNEDFNGVLRYHSGTDFFREKLQEAGGDFKKFHSEMEKLKTMTPEKRKSFLDRKLFSFILTTGNKTL